MSSGLPSPTVRSQLAMAVRARDLADQARALIGDLPVPAEPGERIRQARLVRMLAMTVLDSTVLLELSTGTRWAVIADALGMSEQDTMRRYLPVWMRWCDPVAPELDLDVIGDRVALDPDRAPEELAATLDQWWRRHAEPWETCIDAPVSTAL